MAAALNTAPGTVVGGFAVAISTSDKTTISRNIVANVAPADVAIPWATGPNSANNCAAFYGYTRADLSGAASYTGDTAVSANQMVTAGTNDRFDFNDGTAKTVTIPAGSNLSPATMATNLQTAINAISDGWTVTHPATNFFTIAHSITTATGLFVAKWGSTTNTARAAFGFAAVDLAGSDAYTGASPITTPQTITLNVNDKLTVTASGQGGAAKTAQIAPGTYAPTALAAALQAALNAVSCCYVVLYNTTTHLFTLARMTSASLNTFSLLWASGPSAATSADELLGYSATDLAGATTYTGDLSAEPQSLSLLFGSGPNVQTSIAALLGYSPADLTGISSYTSDLTATPVSTSFTLPFGTNTANSAAFLLGFSAVDLTGASTYTSDLTAMFNNVFSLLFGTGPHVAESAGPVIGYSPVDLTGGTSYASDLSPIYAPNRALIQCATLGIDTRQTTEGTPFAWEIPVTGALGTNVTTFVSAPPLGIRGVGPFAALAFRLVEPSGVVISLGPIDWKFSLLVSST
ncbi:MAG: hypothetical protein KGL39_01400 [Patescibacteria group bacterium]|nr:hypothetical protein [Patescibacteria group bacterium]